MNINDSIVKKDWGWEYLVYRNEFLAIWCLYIAYGQSTSFHCHCSKNTGLVALNGNAIVKFINNSIGLKGLDKVQIFKGRFHSTTALSKSGVYIFEIESPEDKTDLVRFSDQYGREGKGYEDDTHYSSKTEASLNLNVTPNATFAGCNLLIKTTSDKNELMDWDFEDVFVILRGGICEPINKHIVSGPGDVISSHNASFLLKKLDIIPNTEMLCISKYKLV